MATMKGHSGQVKGVVLHPTKPLALSAGSDGTARVWGTERGEAVHTFSK